MNCYEFRDSISSFIDGELNYKKQEQFKEHRSICPQCRQILINTIKTVRSLQRLPALEVSDDFLASLRSRVQTVRDHQLANATPKKSFRLDRLPSFTYGAAAAVLVLAVGFSVMKMQSQSSPPQTQISPTAQENIIQPPPAYQNNPVKLVNSQNPDNEDVSTQDSSGDKRVHDQFQNRIKMVNETTK